MGVSSCSVVILVALGVGCMAAPPSSGAPYQTHRIVLDQNGLYVMLWTPQEDHIVIEVQVATTGYVGLGFSPSGGMKGADIVVGWVDDSGQVFLQDRHSLGYQVPGVDASQDVELLGGYQNNSHTVLRFSRPWITCDVQNDIRLSGDTVRLIWSFNDQDPVDEMKMKIHEKRGTKSVLLKEPPYVLPAFTDDLKHWDVVVSNISVPNDQPTLYWCKLYKIPPITSKVHVTGFTSMIEERNAPHVHHILLYECYLPRSEQALGKWLDVQGVQCYGPNMPASWKYCTQPLVAWAIGGEGESLPDHVGLPLGEEYGGANYFLIEIHYDNPNLKPDIVDSSGLRIFYTEKLRQYDAGILMLGHKISPMQIVPPRRKWLTVGHCHSTCTQHSLPSGGVHVFFGLLHSHLLGSSLSLRHIRDGQELPQFLRDTSYDFNLQQSRRIRPHVTILPGDHLITECRYDSTRRPAPSFGGFATDEEMCLSFLTYYPRTNLSYCLSSPLIQDILDGLGVHVYEAQSNFGNGRQSNGVIDEEAETDMANDMMSEDFEVQTRPLKLSRIFHKVLIKAPEKYANKSLYAILHDDKTWEDDALVERLQNAVARGAHGFRCRTRYEEKSLGVLQSGGYPDFVPYQDPADEQCGIN